jgi:hypothetical protein
VPPGWPRPLGLTAPTVSPAKHTWTPRRARPGVFRSLDTAPESPAPQSLDSHFISSTRPSIRARGPPGRGTGPRGSAHSRRLARRTGRCRCGWPRRPRPGARPRWPGHDLSAARNRRGQRTQQLMLQRDAKSANWSRSVLIVQKQGAEPPYVRTNVRIANHRSRTEWD